jgi:hypothetical protein
MSVRRLAMLACLALTFGTVAGGAAQEGGVPAAAVVAGNCTAPGDSVARLRPPTVRNGGAVPVSLTTIDVALTDLLGAAHAIVLTDRGGVVACGDVAGNADDVYVGVTATRAGGWGGVAWLHARGTQTQVSLFIARGLSGAGASPTEAPTEAPPLPPDEGTPTLGAHATSTPRATGPATPGAGATYTSPSYGYSLAYDPKYWHKSREESTPSDAGALDVLTLTHAYTNAMLVGEKGRPAFTALDLCDARMGQYESDSHYGNVAAREATTGDDNRATVAFDYTYTDDQGNATNWTVWIGCYHAPDDSVLLSVYSTMTRPSYQRLAPVREALIAGLTFPGS